MENLFWEFKTLKNNLWQQLIAKPFVMQLYVSR